MRAAIGSVALLGACSGTSVESDPNEQTAGAPSGAGTGGQPGSGGSRSMGTGGSQAMTAGSPSTGTGGSPSPGIGGSPSPGTGGDRTNDAGAPESEAGEGGAAGAAGAPTGGIGDGGPCGVLTSEESSYRARLVRTLLPPVPNVMGIATQDGGLWISSGSHNVPIATVTHFAVDTGDVMTRFDTTELFSELGTGAYGIEVSDSGLLFSVSGNENQIVRYDEEAASIVDTWGSPTELGPSDLAWLGAELLVSTGTGKLYAADLEPPASVRQFTSYAPSDGRDGGVATCNGVVVWGGLFAGMAVLSPSGELLGSIDREDRPFAQSDLGPLTFYGDRLVVASTAGLDFYALEPVR